LRQSPYTATIGSVIVTQHQRMTAHGCAMLTRNKHVLRLLCLHSMSVVPVPVFVGSMRVFVWPMWRLLWLPRLQWWTQLL